MGPSDAKSLAPHIKERVIAVNPREPCRLCGRNVSEAIFNKGASISPPEALKILGKKERISFPPIYSDSFTDFEYLKAKSSHVTCIPCAYALKVAMLTYGPNFLISKNKTIINAAFQDLFPELKNLPEPPFVIALNKAKISKKHILFKSFVNYSSDTILIQSINETVMLSQSLIKRFFKFIEPEDFDIRSFKAELNLSGDLPSYELLFEYAKIKKAENKRRKNNDKENL